MNDDQFKSLLTLVCHGEINDESLKDAVNHNPTLVNRTNSIGTTLTHCASISKNVDLVFWLISKGADINMRENNGWNLLMYACKYKLVPLVAYLLEHGVDPCSRCDYYTALGLAADNDYHELCILLLSKGVDLEEKYGYIGEDATILTHYGRFSTVYKIWITSKEKEQRKQAICNAWVNGPHPSQCIARWNRRWPFMNFLYGCRYHLLPNRTSFKLHEKINIQEIEKALRRIYVFRSQHLCRLIVGFL